MLLRLQEPAGPDGGGEEGARAEDEEDGDGDGAGVRDEGQGEEAEAQGLGGGDVPQTRRAQEGGSIRIIYINTYLNLKFQYKFTHS